MSYLPAVGETVYLIPPSGYNHMTRCPLTVRDVRNTTAQCEFTEHPAFVNGCRHKANDMRGFRIICNLDNLVPADLSDAVVFYRDARCNMVNAHANNGWLNVSANVRRTINEKMNADRGLEVGATYILNHVISRISNLTGKVYSKTVCKKFKVLSRNSAKFHSDAVYILEHQGKKYKQHGNCMPVSSLVKIGGAV